MKFGGGTLKLAGNCISGFVDFSLGSLLLIEVILTMSSKRPGLNVDKMSDSFVAAGFTGSSTTGSSPRNRSKSLRGSWLPPFNIGGQPAGAKSVVESSAPSVIPLLRSIYGMGLGLTSLGLQGSGSVGSWGS